MVGDIFQPTHLLFVLAVALLVLGPKRLPEVGRALGRTMRDFRSAMSGEETHEREIVDAPTPPPTPAPGPASVVGTPPAAQEPDEHAPAEAPTVEAQTTERQPTPTH